MTLECSMVFNKCSTDFIMQCVSPINHGMEFSVKYSNIFLESLSCQNFKLLRLNDKTSIFIVML